MKWKQYCVFLKNIDGDTGSVSCVFTPGAHELCDDGSNNGKYGTTANGKSFCKDDCGASDETDYLSCVASNPTNYKTACTHGRIGGGSEYFCGDKFVQTTAASETGCGTNGLNCKQVTPENYPGAIPYGSSTHHSDFTTSEECDPSDTLNSRNALCNRKLGLNRNDYYDQGSIGCGAANDENNACKITGVVSDKTSSSYPCGYCGDNEVNGSEECDGETTTSEELCSGSTDYYYSSISQYGFTNNEIMPSIFSEVSNTTYTVSFKDSFCDSSYSGFLNYVNGNGNNKCFYNKTSPTGTGWQKESKYGQNAYCSTIGSSDKKIAEVVFQINVPEAGGYIGFKYRGSCESGSKGEKIIDGLVVAVDRENIFSPSHAEILYDLASGTVSDWNSFKKPISAGTHKIYFWYLMDKSDQTGDSKFCIDDLQFWETKTQTDNPSNMTCDSSTCKKNSSGVCYGTWCGDGTKNGLEFCDSGQNNTDDYGLSGRCNRSCTGYAPHCGDGIKNGSEACDGADKPNYCYKKTYSEGCSSTTYYIDIWTSECNGSCELSGIEEWDSYTTNSNYTIPSEVTQQYGAIQQCSD